MDFLNPVYSEDNECQDCYKCIRECPVKAIKVDSSRAKVVGELCIACGHCVSICPAGAKKVRDDVKRVRHLLKRKSRVFLSLAPSFVSEFQDISPQQLISAIKHLGFCGVSETALGAQEVSAKVAEDLRGEQDMIALSTACPAAVEYILKYMPEQTKNLTDVLSPVLAHCTLLRHTYGDDIGIVFAGPCVAKKLEAAAHPELLDVAITFEDLRRLLKIEHITPGSEQVSDDDVFMPEQSTEGAFYPVQGGMIEATRLSASGSDAHFLSISGIANIGEALKNLDMSKVHGKLFVELLACEGGCVKGPKITRRSALTSQFDVLNYASIAADAYPRKPKLSITDNILVNAVHEDEYSEEEIQLALLKVGKRSSKDELDCGGCGYGSCREFAKAVLSGKAETSMCVSYMRNQAQKMANALLKTIPYAAVIVRDDLKVVECNKKFVSICGEDAAIINETVPGLEGAELPGLVPFGDLFETVLISGKDILRRYIKFHDNVFSTTVFTIEPHRVVGAMLVDVTGTEIRREQIVDKAQTVIQNTLSTVQEIAFKLGKSAAESECILNSIIEGFSVSDYPDISK